jgi:hypothetical protein
MRIGAALVARRGSAMLHTRIRSMLLGLIAGISVPAWPCGFHDPAQMQLGLMNWVYPESLHVRTAVWQAQLDGRLARDELSDRAELTAEARAQLGYLRTTRLLGQLRGTLAGAKGPEPRPTLAVVLLGPMLWSRYEMSDGGLQLQVHVNGPQPGDIVVVTESAVVDALIAGNLSGREAFELGLLRIYGRAADAENAVEWLSAVAH